MARRGTNCVLSSGISMGICQRLVKSAARESFPYWNGRFENRFRGNLPKRQKRPFLETLMPVEMIP